MSGSLVRVIREPGRLSIAVAELSVVLEIDDAAKRLLAESICPAMASQAAKWALFEAQVRDGNEAAVAGAIAHIKGER